MRKNTGAWMRAVSTVIAVTLAGPALAQAPQPAAPPSGAAPPVELYHLHFVKAAAGKLPDLIETYKQGPAPDKGDPQFDPVILRHREGGEWDLVVITPLGQDHTLRTDVPLPAEVQAFNQRVAPITDWHSDSFVVGPPWDAVRPMLVPSSAAPSAVYTVSDYRSIPGHRPQLRQTLDGLARDAAGRSVLFSHAEGGPWNFVNIVRFDSWAELGQQGAPAARSAAQPDAGLQLREHMAVHHDSIVVYRWGGPQ